MPFTRNAAVAVLSASMLFAAALPAPASAQTAQQAATELGQAYQAIKDKDYTAAERRLAALREQSPNDAYVLLNLGVVYQMTGRREQAIALYERVAGIKDDELKSGATSASTGASETMVGRSAADIARYNLRTLRGQ